MVRKKKNSIKQGIEDVFSPPSTPKNEQGETDVKRLVTSRIAYGVLLATFFDLIDVSDLELILSFFD